MMSMISICVVITKPMTILCLQRLTVRYFVEVVGSIRAPIGAPIGREDLEIIDLYRIMENLVVKAWHTLED